ncbi:sugar transferase [Tellurirhabdus rosea]|uniref:sugar transferase n=1 Tax=Tellurirhabdus rosea TaxID=2674997 RepID=UPI0022524D29|nr:sugar transferase [Tellurirhabdus rosea]
MQTLFIPTADPSAAPPSEWPEALSALGYGPEDGDALPPLLQTGAGFAVLRSADEVISGAKTILTPLLNRVPDLFRYLRTAYLALPLNGHLVVRLETNEHRKERLLRSLPAGLSHFRYLLDFLLHRMMPRIYPVKLIYRRLFTATRALSKAEVLGRLYHAGFTVERVCEQNNHLLVIARKAVDNHVPPPPSSEGVLLRMRRIGYGGLPFNVYKLRTMHPYSEHLQEYLIQTSGLEAGGKFKDDFRISTVGKFLRKYWLDELPMAINLLKGDLKLVGVRPLSAHYLSLYPDELKQERAKTRPGLIPPYYADLPGSFPEIVESELRYLRAYAAAPLRTDLRYLWKVVYNIFWKRTRSK